MRYYMFEPSLQLLLEAEKLGRVTAHRQNGLVGFKYSMNTIYTGDWDDVTLNARGIVFNEKTGEIVARPFKKFFNYQEFYTAEGLKSELYLKVPQEFKPNLEGPFRCMEKVDGSLGIVFLNPFTHKWQVKTGGSFDSDQAVWAQEWFDKNINTNLLIEGFTYCFEIVSKEDIHPIRYDYEGMVLLGAISNSTGEEVPLSQIQNIAQRLNVRMVELYEFEKFLDAVEWAKKLPKTQEGLVITFDNGFKTKAKSDDWCQLAKMFEGMTKWNIWVCYDIEKDFFHAHVDKHNSYKPIDDEVLFIPEELPEIREYAEWIRTEITNRTDDYVQVAQQIMDAKPNRKDQFQMAVDTMEQNEVPIIMCAIDYLLGKKSIKGVKISVHKMIQPQNEEV